MRSSTDTDLIAARCQLAGLDLHAVTSVGRYNALVPADFHLPGDADSLAIVIGNTRALWPHIDQFVTESSDPVGDPVDEYVERVLRHAVAGVDGVIDIRFSHEPPPRRVAIQRLADVAGLAWLSPSHLCVHATFGPWIALRAAVVLDGPAPPPAAELSPPCECALHCLPKLQQALEAGEATSDDVIEHWRLWVAMRDACPVARQHRYSDEQIAYHYIGERPARWG
jgi:cyanocobalamin reductase (cyanide-eliminating) / alkylcobalamin dealkylase